MVQAPAKITKIEFQKKNKNRVSVFLNDEFAFGLDAGLVVKYNLKKGDVLEPEQISGLLLNEEKRRIRESAFRFLAGRAHSEQELRLKLQRKGFSEDLIAQVLAELKQQKWLDDRDFALAFARSRIANKPMGEKLLRSELWQKGVSETDMEAAVQEAYGKNAPAELAAELVRSRQGRYQHLEPDKRKKRLYDFLLRRGFDWETARDAVTAAFKEAKV